MDNDSRASKEVRDIEEKTIATAIGLLKKYNHDINDYLAANIAAICDVDVNDMLQASTPNSIVFARWLYWYAYRYMTNDSFETMANKLSAKRKFTSVNISIAVTKMSMMISNEAIWTKRWSIVKKIVKAILEDDSLNVDEVVKVKVVYPKNVLIELKQE